MKDITKKILQALDKEEWKSTNEISKTLHINWYRVEFILNTLESEGKVETQKRSNRFTYWRLK